MQANLYAGHVSRRIKMLTLASRSQGVRALGAKLVSDFKIASLCKFQDPKLAKNSLGWLRESKNGRPENLRQA